MDFKCLDEKTIDLEVKITECLYFRTWMKLSTFNSHAMYGVRVDSLSVGVCFTGCCLSII